MSAMGGFRTSARTFHDSLWPQAAEPLAGVMSSMPVAAPSCVSCVETNTMSTYAQWLDRRFTQSEVRERLGQLLNTAFPIAREGSFARVVPVPSDRQAQR
jgi:hypothetical protein